MNEERGVPKSSEPLDPFAETCTPSGTVTAAVSPIAAGPPARMGLEGQLLLHFEVTATLGEGGMGVVYQALDTRLARHVALKVLARSRGGEEAARAVFREARRAAALAHPGIAAVYEVHDEHDPPFFVIELVHGHSLRARLTDGPLSVPEATDITVQLACALGHAHEAGIVHRDVKPENVMVTADGKVKLLDFGIAKEIVAASGPVSPLAESLVRTADGELIGTPEYMAPEQALGRVVDARADVFALGVVLYEMLTGERPFRRGTLLETALAVVNDDAPRIRARHRHVPPALARVVERCLSKRPASRFATGTALAVALGGIQGASHVGPGRASERSYGRRALAATVLFFVASLAVVAGFRLMPHRRASPAAVRQAAAPVAGLPHEWHSAGEVLPLSAFPNAEAASISHDGKLIAVPTDAGSVALLDVQGRPVRRITRARAGRPSRPRASRRTTARSSSMSSGTAGPSSGACPSMDPPRSNCARRSPRPAPLRWPTRETGSRWWTMRAYGSDPPRCARWSASRRSHIRSCRRT